MANRPVPQITSLLFINHHVFNFPKNLLISWNFKTHCRPRTVKEQHPICATTFSAVSNWPESNLFNLFAWFCVFILNTEWGRSGASQLKSGGFVTLVYANFRLANCRNASVVLHGKLGVNFNWFESYLGGFARFSRKNDFVEFMKFEFCSAFFLVFVF
jgi:hypothetical protein